jgi:hypothetical protein
MLLEQEKIMKTSGIALLCLVLPCLGVADEPRYTFVEGAYQYVEFEDFDADGDGWFVAGSVALGERMYVLASYAKVGFDFGVDADTLRLGIGGSLPLSDPFHLVAETGYAKAGVDSSFGDTDDHGYFVSGGARWKVTPRFEVTGLLHFAELEKSGFGTSLSTGVLFHLTQNLALGAAADSDGDTTGYSANLRYYF